MTVVSVSQRPGSKVWCPNLVRFAPCSERRQGERDACSKIYIFFLCRSVLILCDHLWLLSEPELIPYLNLLLSELCPINKYVLYISSFEELL